MIREHAFGFAAVTAAILSVGGVLAIAQAQQPPGSAAGVADKAAAPRPKGATNAATGGFSGGSGGGSAPVGMPPGAMSGMRGGAMMPGGYAVDDDPETNELAHAEAVVASESDEIIGRFADTENAAERKQLVAELRETLAKQFDIQKQRRELELSRIEERVRKLKDQIKKRNDARETIIDRRLEQLVNDADGLGWSAPAGATTGSSSGSYSVSPGNKGPISSTPRRR